MTSFVAEPIRKADVLSTPASTYTLAFASAVPVGDTLVMAVNTTIGGTGGQTGYSVTDTKGNTWTQNLLQDAYSTGNKSANGNLGFLTCTVTTALTTSDTLTVTSGGGTLTRWCILVEQFTGISGFDAASGVTASTASPTVAGASGAQNNETIFGAVIFPDTGGTITATPTAPSGATVPLKLSTYPVNGSSPRAIQVWYHDVATSGARVASATVSATEPTAIGVLALKQTVVVTSPTHLWNGSAWVPTTRALTW